MNTFSEAFDPKQNRLHLIRHMAASMVLIDHAFILSGKKHALSYLGFQISLGLLGVAIFFVISGALITASFLQSRSWSEFLWRRVLRIYPAYITCLLITATVIGPIAARVTLEDSGLSSIGFWKASPTPVGYILNNALLIQFQNRIGQLFSGHAEAFSINGSLWSIPWEAGCYLLVLALGVSGLLRRVPIFVVVLLFGAYLNLILFPAGSIFGRIYLSERVTMLPVYFLSGAVFYLYRNKIPCSPLLGAASIVGFVTLGLAHWPTASLLLPYSLFWSARRIQPLVTSSPDISYGLYIYSFPLQQTILAWCPGLSLQVYILLSLILVTPFSVLSWYLIEKPCLRFKRWNQASDANSVWRSHEH